jgi:hypothetical protein
MPPTTYGQNRSTRIKPKRDNYGPFYIRTCPTCNHRYKIKVCRVCFKEFKYERCTKMVCSYKCFKRYHNRKYYIKHYKKKTDELW